MRKAPAVIGESRYQRLVKLGAWECFGRLTVTDVAVRGPITDQDGVTY